MRIGRWIARSLVDQRPDAIPDQREEVDLDDDDEVWMLRIVKTSQQRYLDPRAAEPERN